MLWGLLETVLPVRRHERQLTLAMFLHSFFGVGVFVVGRSARDTLFLAHVDKSMLSWMYVASAVAVTLTGLAYAPLANKYRRHTLAMATAVFFAVLFVVLWMLERAHLPGIYSIIYIFVELAGALIQVQFWTLANELFNAREAKRLYGFIGAGGMFANILLGLLSVRVATRFGTDSLMWMCAALLLGTAAAALAAGQAGRQRLFAKAATGRTSSKRTGGASLVLQSDHLRSVALLSMVTFFTVTLVDFEFKVIASSTYSGAQLAAYFGYFSAVVGALALGLQLFGTSRILQRVGVIGALAMLPGSLLLGNFTLILFPVLWAAATAKGADSLFRYSVNDATTQILYLPVPAQVRAAAKTFIDSVVKPVSIAAAGLVLAGYRAWGSGSPYHVAYGSLVLAGLWLLVVFSLRKKYIASLHETVKTKRLDLKSARPRMTDTAAEQVLERAIKSTDTQEVINALALLPHLQMVSLDHPVEALLDHQSPAVRKAALDYYAHRQSMRFANSVFRRFEDKDSTVRAAAVSAFCAIGRDKAVRSVSSHLLDQDPEVRSAAITGIMRYGGLDGVLAAAEALKGLIIHTDDAMREHAARVLGSIGVKNFYQPVMQLMTDPAERVRRAAVNAAAMLKSPELVLPLIYRTQDIATLHGAISALVSYGPSIIPTLGKILSNQHEGPAIRHAAARVLGRLPSPEAIELLSSHLDEPDEELRRRVYRALARAVREQKFTLKDSRGVHDALSRELHLAFQTLHRAELLQLHGGPSSATPRAGAAAAKALLSSALTEKVAHAEARIFLLLAVIYPDADMELIYSGMQDSGVDGARRRANAAELFDNLLPRDLKKRLLPLIEETPRQERLAHVAEFYQFQTETEHAVLVALTKDEAPWVRACATWTLSALQSGDHATSVDDQVFLDGINDINPVVREIALVSLNRAAPERAQKAAEGRLRDDTPAVRRQAALIATRRAAKRA